VLGREDHSKRLLSHIKIWVCCREPLPVQLAHDFFDNFNYVNYYSGDRVLCNYYGSTEVMGIGTCHVMRSAVEVKECAKMPIGQYNPKHLFCVLCL
jgi:acyl-coenzyme A synthetase/AMP-(fatty) acid ligase